MLWPPLRVTSRDTVEGARPSRPAILRSDSPAASPREISSRSDSDNLMAARVRSRGRIPPVSPTYLRIEASERPRCRPMIRNDTPARTSRQISNFSATDMRAMNTPSTC